MKGQNMLYWKLGRGCHYTNFNFNFLYTVFLFFFCFVFLFFVVFDKNIFLFIFFKEINFCIIILLFRFFIYILIFNYFLLFIFYFVFLFFTIFLLSEMDFHRSVSNFKHNFNLAFKKFSCKFDFIHHWNLLIGSLLNIHKTYAFICAVYC